MQIKKEDAAAALLSLASLPVVAKEPVSSQGKPTGSERFEHGIDLALATDEENATPELTRSTRTSFSQASEGPYTPEQRLPSFSDFAKSVGYPLGF